MSSPHFTYSSTKFRYCTDAVGILALLCAGIRPITAGESAVVTDNVLVLTKTEIEFEV
jgi:hypothetical protein